MTLTFLNPLYILCISVLVNFVFVTKLSMPSFCSPEQLNEHSNEPS